MKSLFRMLAFTLAVVMLVSSGITTLAGTQTPTLPVCTQHTGGQATCQGKAVCSLCGIEYGENGTHVYSGSADTTCNFCDYVRTITSSPTICLGHQYSADCDSECNLCGRSRQVETGHNGGNATCEKKAICTACGMIYGELAQHTYENDQDASCSVCGFIRNVEGDPSSPTVCFKHVFDDCLDADCNACGYVRSITGHKGGTATCENQAVCELCYKPYGELANHSYENDCDPSCNVCGDLREVDDHKYTDSYDTTCDICGHVREITVIILGDANHDAVVTKEDFDLIQQYINGWDVDIDLTASDFNGDGKINNRDLGQLLRYLSGLELVPEPEKPEEKEDDTPKPNPGIVGGGTDLWD